MRVILLLLLSMLLSGCGYNQIQQKDEAVKAGWSEVLNQYKRRADLIPNLVGTVKGYAGHEAQVLTAVTEARARVGQVQVNADDAASLAQFQQAQGELASALSRLLVVSENYPQLKDYNTYIRSFPQNLVAMVFGYKQKPNFTVEDETRIADAPSVDFGAAPAEPAPVPPVVEPAASVVNPPQPALPPVQGGNAPQPAPTE